MLLFWPCDGQWKAFYCVNRADHLRQNRGLITAARSNFERPVPWLELRQACHHRYHVGLADGLVVSNGQRAIGVGLLPQICWDELVPGNSQKSL